MKQRIWNLLSAKDEEIKQKRPECRDAAPQARSPGPAGSKHCRLFQGDHSLAYCDGMEWKIPAPETWEAIRRAATMAGTLMNLRN